MEEKRIKSTSFGSSDHGNRFRLVAPLGAYMTNLDYTIITISLPNISATFQGDISSFQWTITGYLVAMSAFMLIFARPADLMNANTSLITSETT